MLLYLSAGRLWKLIRSTVLPKKPNPRWGILYRSSPLIFISPGNTYLWVHTLPYDLIHALPRYLGASLGYDPCTDYLPISLIWNANDRSFQDGWVRCKYILNLDWEQVLSPSDDDVLHCVYFCQLCQSSDCLHTLILPKTVKFRVQQQNLGRGQDSALRK
jgi:hypothetical protein